MIEKAYIVVVTEEQRPAVARVHVIGSQGDWRLVHSAPYRREGGGLRVRHSFPRRASLVDRGVAKGEVDGETSPKDFRRVAGTGIPSPA